MAFAPDGRLFVSERIGRVRIFDAALRSSSIALTVGDVFAQGEAGLLGLALDPDFSKTPFVYLYYTARAGAGAVNRIVRYREAGNQLTERVVLLDGIPGNTIHNGGRLRFGPDNLLYITTGDAGAPLLAQDLGSLAGKILRLNRDGTTPRGNAFSSPVYSWGHRNPQGLDWHPVTGDLWATEHGNTANDEVNVVQSGANYGWPRIEAAQTMTGMETPVTFYNPTVAPSGAAFYRGQRFPQFANNLFVATLRGTLLLRLRIDPASPRRLIGQERLLEGQFGRIRDVVTGPDGYLYFCTNNRDGRGTPTSDDDRIARLVPAS
jgi:glucose/arabinose dehydrogenase